MNNEAMSELRERQVQAYAHGITNGRNSDLLWGGTVVPEPSTRVDAPAPMHLFQNTSDEVADVASAHDLGFVDGFHAEHPYALREDADEALGEFRRRFPMGGK